MPKPSLKGGSPPLRIFVVENDPDTLKYLKRYLEQCGHTVSSSLTMSKALKSFPALKCDVLISDIGLPDGDGWELLKRLQSSRPVFAIAMSGFGMTTDRQKSEKAGFRYHLLKPFMPAELDRMLKEAAQEKKE